MPTERKLNLPFQKPLTVVIMQDNGPNQAKEDLAKIADEHYANRICDPDREAGQHAIAACGFIAIGLRKLAAELERKAKEGM